MYRIALTLAWLACDAHGQNVRFPAAQSQTTESVGRKRPLKGVDADLSSQTTVQGYASAEKASGRFLFAPQLASKWTWAGPSAAGRIPARAVPKAAAGLGRHSVPGAALPRAAVRLAAHKGGAAQGGDEWTWNGLDEAVDGGYSPKDRLVAPRSRTVMAATTPGIAQEVSDLEESVIGTNIAKLEGEKVEAKLEEVTELKIDIAQVQQSERIQIEDNKSPIVLGFTDASMVSAPAVQSASFRGTSREYLLKAYGCTFGLIGIVISSLMNRLKRRGSALPAAENSTPGLMPCGDALDRKISILALPAMVNFLLSPISGSVDLYFIGKLGSALAIAGQAAANQVLFIAGSFIFVIPIVTTPRVAKANAAGKTDELQEAVGEAFFMSGVLSMIMATALWFGQRSVLLTAGTAATFPFSLPYMLACLPALVLGSLSSAGISAFRGIMDTVTPLRIAIFSTLANCLLNPFFMFSTAVTLPGGMALPGLGLGIAGAAAATSVSQLVGLSLCMSMLFRKKLMRWGSLLRLPSRESLPYFAKAGGAVLIRSLALNAGFFAITKATQMMDTTGTAAAAHAITLQLFQLGGVLLFAVSSVAQIIIPSEWGKEEEGRVEATRPIANRLLAWGALLGAFLGAAQVAGLPLLGVFTKLPEVQAAAQTPSIIAAFLQLINGVCYVAEGLMTGLGDFKSLAVGNIVATAALLMLVLLGPGGSSLPAIWASFSVFMAIRLAFAMRFHFFSGPLALRKASGGTQAQELASA